MSLTAGTILGAYEITALIGAGGLGEAYRARDLRLERAVALKILPEAFADDPDRVARFQREARTLAALNHRNIAIVHGFEEPDASPGSRPSPRSSWNWSKDRRWPIGSHSVP